MRDISERGLFLRPVEPGNQSQRDHAVQPGDSVDLHLFPGGLEPGLKTKGTVRWVGHSREHGCEGVGIQLAQPIAFDEQV